MESPSQIYHRKYETRASEILLQNNPRLLFTFGCLVLSQIDTSATPSVKKDLLPWSVQGCGGALRSSTSISELWFHVEQLGKTLYTRTIPIYRYNTCKQGFWYLYMSTPMHENCLNCDDIE